MTNAERLILRGKPWPYGASGLACDRMIAWATERGLMLPGSRKCLHWLDKGRCPHDGWCNYDEGFCREGRRSHHWMDHVTAWRGADGRRLMLAQPYNVSDDGLADLEKVAKAWSFHINVSNTSWYGHGTIAIEVTHALSLDVACVLDRRMHTRADVSHNDPADVSHNAIPRPTARHEVNPMTHADHHILRGNGAPYGALGPAYTRMIDWATERQLVLSSGQCLHWLDKGRCPHNGYRDPEDICTKGLRGHSWMDHITCWRGADGRRLCDKLNGGSVAK